TRAAPMIPMLPAPAVSAAPPALRGWRISRIAAPVSCASAANGVNRVRTCVSLSRSEEHTSELQARENLVCRLLLEKKKKNAIHNVLQDVNHTKARNTMTIVTI